jgi:Kelch motif protein/galactose oxidase-like protein
MRYVSALLLFVMSPSPTIEWTERHSMLQAEAGGAAAYQDGDLVIAGGTAWDKDEKLWLKTVQIYHPPTDLWREGPSLPLSLAYGPFVSSENGLEIFGGSDGKTAHRTSWKLNSAKTRWQQTGSAPADVLLGRAARIGDSVFLFGGCPDIVDLTKCSDAVWRRDGDGSWHRVSTIPDGPVALSATASTASAIYLFGGCSMPASGKVVNHDGAYRYDPATNRWKTIRKLPVANRGLTALAVDDRSIYLFGGYADSRFTSEVISYDIQKDSYHQLPSMPLGAASIEFVRNGRTVYGAGGEDRMRSRSARLFEGRFTEVTR